jgi:TetR/AcrR family transcriptional regulator, regulator of cefoperazone and chloramphenicol sensitivity
MSAPQADRVTRRAAQAPVEDRMASAAVVAGTTKDRLIQAAEHVMARHGIDGARVRDINTLAGQRNPSALHYHFGSRIKLVEAILLAHQEAIDEELAPQLDALEARADATIHEIVGVVVVPLVRCVDTPRGRNFLRIVPQVMDALGAGLRRGDARPTTPQMHRILDLLESRLHDLPQAVRRERLVAYILLLTDMCANRARAIESGAVPDLAPDQFAALLTDVLAGALQAADTVPGRRAAADRPPRRALGGK